MDKYAAKIACAFCETVHPTNIFRAFKYEVGLWYGLRHPTVFWDMGMMNLVPVNRYYSQHRKVFFTPDYTTRTSKRIPVRLLRDPTLRWIQYQIFRR